MGKEESPEITRRSRRTSISASSTSKSAGEPSKSCNLRPLSINDLVYKDERQVCFDELIDLLPGRRLQILELIRHLGPVDSPMIPLFVYGGASTGKTSTVLNVFRHLRRPFVYSSCITCYSPRILFESVLNQLLFHRKSESNGYSSAKRCERPAEFVNFLRDALCGVIENLKGVVGKSSSKKMESLNGKMVYLIFDSLELVREWDKSANILPFLFKLDDILKVPEVGIIFISNASPDTYHSDTGYVEPFPIYFPDYTEDEIRLIFMKGQENPKLYSSFLDVVLKPFSRVTRRVDELSTAFQPLFTRYCEPLSDAGAVLSEDVTRKLFSHLQPHIAPSLNQIFSVPSWPSPGDSADKEITKRKGSAKKLGAYESSLEEIDFHMSTSAKYLLISAFLASRNPATLDASFFDSTGGSDNRKRKRKTCEKSKEQKEAAEQELLMKGPGTFPLERVLAIFQCLTSVADYDEGGNISEKEQEEWSNALMSDVLLQLSSLCNANFISKGGSCPLEGSTRYRSTVSEDLALKVARSLKFPLSKYLYRR